VKAVVLADDALDFGSNPWIRVTALLRAARSDAATAACASEPADFVVFMRVASRS
jgi:hypothetical protein